MVIRFDVVCGYQKKLFSSLTWSITITITITITIAITITITIPITIQMQHYLEFKTIENSRLSTMKKGKSFDTDMDVVQLKTLFSDL